MGCFVWGTELTCGAAVISDAMVSWVADGIVAVVPTGSSEVRVVPISAVIFGTSSKTF